MKEKELLNAIRKYYFVKENEITKKEIKIDNISFTKIRDILYAVGSIEDEDLDNNMYTVIVKAGAIIPNNAVVVVAYTKRKLKIWAYAKEGIINNHTASKAINKVIDKVAKKKRKKNKLMLFCFWCIVSIIVVWLYLDTSYAVDETKKYNSEVKKYNNIIIDYNQKTKKASVANIEGFDEHLDSISLVGEGWIDVIKSMTNGNSGEKIHSDTKTLKAINKNVSGMIKIISFITNPKAADIANKISDIQGISDIECVTENNDPNGLLNKKNGGYSGCIYFIKDSVKRDIFQDSQNSLERGTDGGGCIEIYSSLKDASDRCEYLGEFDGSLLNSGSYALVGTMVIRTSYILSDEEQYKLTESIVKEITNV